MKKMLLILMFTALGIIFSGITISANHNAMPRYPIFLKSEPDFSLQRSELMSYGLGYSGYYIMQLDHIPDENERQLFATNGIELASYIPENSWFVRARNADLSVLKGLEYFGKVLPEYKIPSHLKNIEGKVNITITFFEKDKFSANAIYAAGNVLVDSDFELVLETDQDVINSIAELEKVKWIELYYPKRVVFNDGARSVSSIEALNGTPYNLLGTNITVAVWDSGYGNHTDFNSRRIVGDPGEGSDVQHSTHVAGTILGDGGQSQLNDGTPNQWRGIAPNATALVYEWWDDVAELISEYNKSIGVYNASVSSNSWGLGVSPVTVSNCVSFLGSYNSDSQYIDNITRGYLGERMTIVWSVGNERTDNCGTLGFTYNTTTPYSTSKNTISVGAIEKNLDIATYTSWGPTDDGRIKPDIVSVGTSVKSTDLGDSYTILSGTSMAAPVVAGISALIYEDYKRIYNKNPLPSTVKALILHTATDLNNTGPDYHTGYGLANATKVIEVLRENSASNVLIEGNVTQGTNNTYDIKINGQSELKITLAWDDYPADPAASKTLVNDIDIIAYNSTGIRFYPWTLNSIQPAGGAVQTKKDNINNVEQIYVSSPSNGVWTIIVNGTLVPNGPQNYSIVSSIAFGAAPSVAFVSPSDNNQTVENRNWTYINITLSETITNATLEWNGINETMEKANATSWFLNKTGLESGNYTFRVYANDTSNITGVSETRWVFINYPGLLKCSNLTVENTVYTILGSIAADSDCFAISENSITLDGQGFEINYTAGNLAAVYTALNNLDNITVKNIIINVTSSSDGIFLELKNSTIVNNTIESYSKNGIKISHSKNIRIFNNTINIYGVSSASLLLSYSNLTSVENNTFNSTSGYNIFLEAEEISHAVHNIANNSGDGKDILYFKNLNHAEISAPETFSVLIVANSTTVNITNLALEGDGILSYFVSNSTILNNSINVTKSEISGIYMSHSSNNTAKNNTIKVTGSLNSRGISIISGISNSFLGNVINMSGSHERGILLQSSNFTVGENNTIYTNGERSHGVFLNETHFANLANNTIETHGNFSIGIYIFYSSTNSTIRSNFIKTFNDSTSGSDSLDGNAAFGIQIRQSYENILYNNTINTTISQSVNSTSSDYNAWNLSVGNFYISPGSSGYSDLCVDENSTGICNDNLTHSENNTDFLVIASIDTKPPEITVISPKNNTITKLNWTMVNVTINDTRNSINSCILQWNNVNESMNFIGSGLNISCFLNKTDAEGAHSFIIWTNDTLNNTNSTIVANVTFDFTAPVITFVSPSPNNQTLANANSFIINISINEEAFIAVLEFNGQNFSMSGSGGSWYKNITITSVGNYTFKVWANDTANHTNFSETRWVKITDTVKPLLNVSSPTATVYSSSSVAINYIPNDNIGTDKCWFKLNTGTNTSISGCLNTTVTALQGSNIIIIAVNDTSGNVNQTTITFTYTPSSTSSGSGGGGITAPTATPTPSATPVLVIQNKTNVVSRSEIFVSSIIANTKRDITDISLQETGLKKIGIHVSKTVNSIRITAERLETKPVEVTELLEKVFHYIKIDKFNITDSDIKNATIEFYVEKSWISENSIDPNTIRLQRFENASWKKLMTKKTGENKTHISYEGESPGLSIFAITGELLVPTPTPIPTPTPTPAKAKPVPNPVMYIMIFIAIIIVSAGSYMYYRKNLMIPKETIIIVERKLKSGSSLRSVRRFLINRGYHSFFVDRALKKAMEKI